MRILIVDDEPKTGDHLRQGLTEAGFVVDLARDGLDGLHLATTGDHLVKPFGFYELLARVRSLLRRGKTAESADAITVLSIGLPSANRPLSSSQDMRTPS